MQQCKVLSLIKAWDQVVNHVVSSLHDRVVIIVQETERQEIIFLCFVQVGDKVAKCFKPHGSDAAMLILNQLSGATHKEKIALFFVKNWDKTVQYFTGACSHCFIPIEALGNPAVKQLAALFFMLCLIQVGG